MIVSEQEKAIFGSSSVAEIMRAILDSEHETDQGREHFWAMGVNRKNILQYVELVSLGSLCASIVHPREVFRLAVMKGVAALIFCHNHPTGDPRPSQEDIELTRRLRGVGEILGIEVLDHVIIGKTYFSFKDNGLFIPLYASMLPGNNEVQRQGVPEATPAPLRRKRTPKKKESNAQDPATTHDVNQHSEPALRKDKAKLEPMADDKWVFPPVFDMRSRTDMAELAKRTKNLQGA
jgi:DNA repair protein RadC